MANPRKRKPLEDGSKVEGGHTATGNHEAPKKKKKGAVEDISRLENETKLQNLFIRQ
jgi:hypothetical protein